MRNYGFTIIELVVVVTITAVLGVVFTDLLTQSLRAENKVRVINQVKQNGQVIMDRLTNEIRQTQRIVCADDTRADGSHTLVLLIHDGTYTRYRFYPPVTGSKNGYLAFDKLTEVTATTCDEDQAEGIQNKISNTDTVNGVSLNYVTNTSVYPEAEFGDFRDKFFKITSQPGSPDSIIVKFIATAGEKSGQAYEATAREGGILFATTVQLKNW